MGPEEYEGGSTGGEGRDGQGGDEVGQEEGGTRVTNDRSRTPPKQTDTRPEKGQGEDMKGVDSE